MTQFLQALDHSTIQEMKDHAMAELITEEVFGSDEWSVFAFINIEDWQRKA